MGDRSSDNDIVVGVDGSPASSSALAWAANAAVRHSRPLRLIHGFVWPAFAAAYGLPPAAWSNDQIRVEAETLIQRMAQEAHDLAPGVDVHGVVLHGSPASVLVDASRDAAMVVLGSRGAGGFSGLLLGSVSTQVARHGSGPIVVVPLEQAAADKARPRIVVGADGSAGAEPALGFAFAEAAVDNATVTLVRAWQPPHPTWRDGAYPLDEHRAELETAEHESLAESVAPWRQRYPEVPVELQLVGDQAAHALTAAAEGARLLVVGARGHGGFGGLHLGSVSLQVLHHSRVPVAVVHPGHHEARRTP